MIILTATEQREILKRTKPERIAAVKARMHERIRAVTCKYCLRPHSRGGRDTIIIYHVPDDDDIFERKVSNTFVVAERPAGRDECIDLHFRFTAPFDLYGSWGELILDETEIGTDPWFIDELKAASIKHRLNKTLEPA